MRLTEYAHGGGCACKIPPGELEEMVAGLIGVPSETLLVGLEHGDDAAAVRLDGNGTAVLSTVDFFTPVVDDAYDWGRIAAANAFSDIYAMGGRPILAVNLVCWPRDLLPMTLAADVLRGGLAVATEAGCPVAGGHSVDDPEPKYGMAVTGVAPSDRLLRTDAGVAGQPLSLSKPLGIGVLNSRHKQTGEVFPQAVETMVALNRAASEAALASGARCATDVTGFGLLGHLYKLARASNLTAVINADAVPYLEGARAAGTAIEDPGQHAQILAKARPQELTGSILPEPVDVEDARRLAERGADLEPVRPIVAIVVAGERLHRHRIAPYHADLTGGGGGGF